MNLDYTISHTNTNFKFLFMEIPKKTTWRNALTYFLDSGAIPLRTATPRSEF